MNDKRTEPAGPLAMLVELTEFLEALLETTEDGATDLLTNEGEDLVAKAREVLGRYRASGVFELRARVCFEGGETQELRCSDFPELARRMEQRLERFDGDIGVIRLMTIVVDPIEPTGPGEKGSDP
jgi:hypothetical protein